MNDKIAEAGQATQFGSEARPDAAAAQQRGGEANGKRHDIRRAIKKLLNAELPNEELTDENCARAIYGPENTAGLSPAERIARAKIAAAIAGNMVAAHALEESMCGKLTEKRVTAGATLEELLTGKYKDDETE